MGIDWSSHRGNVPASAAKEQLLKNLSENRLYRGGEPSLRT